MKLHEQVIAWLAQQDIAVYLVGGCVRDFLLGRENYDLDVVVDGDALLLARRTADHFEGAYYPLDEARNTGRAILPDVGGQRLVVDVARMRGADLAADLAERDFTINAIAANVRTPGVVVDQHHGLADLQSKSIRPVSDASLRNDPLRALRAIRLAAELGFSLAPETECLIRRDGSGLGQVASERIRDEVARLLSLPRAAPLLHRMDDLGLLVTIVPELEPLRGLAQPRPHHLDALGHSLETVYAIETLLEQQTTGSNVPEALTDGRFDEILTPFHRRLKAHLERVTGDARTRLVTLKLAALLHDTGKPAAYGVDEEGSIHYHGHEREGARIAAEVFRRLRFNNVEVRMAKTIVRHHMRPLLLAKQEKVSSRAVYRFFRDSGNAGVDTLLHALADQLATYAPRTGDEERGRLARLAARMLADYWERREERVVPPRLIDGNDLLHEFDLQPGPRIGELLEAVREAQVSGEVSTRAEALSLVRRKLG